MDDHALTEALRQMESLAKLTQQNISAMAERLDTQLTTTINSTLEQIRQRETDLEARIEIQNQQIIDLRSQIDRLMNITEAWIKMYQATGRAM
jgi:predicted  nucleic acid-binding Zn-ribbon protein